MSSGILGVLKLAIPSVEILESKLPAQIGRLIFGVGFGMCQPGLPALVVELVDGGHAVHHFDHCH